jgi:hypothetical protein
MTPKALAELIEREYYGGDVSDDAGLERIDFIQHVYAAYAFLVKREYFDKLRLLGEKDINNQYIQIYPNVEVKYNEEEDYYYSDLPTDPISLPNDMGIYQISKMQGTQEPFKPMNLGMSFIFSNLPSYTTYYSDNKKVIYQNLEPEVKKVKMAIIAARPNDIHDDDVHEIKELVLNQLLKVKNIPQDKLNDSNPNSIDINGRK